MIEGYIIAPVRRKAAEDLDDASKCFRNDCSLLNHVDRDETVQKYYQCVENGEIRDEETCSDEPDDADLLEVAEGTISYEEEEEAHQENRADWPLIIGRIFSANNREMFQRRFGLDIWFTFVSLPDDRRFSEEYGFPQATIAYLTLPDCVTRRHRWDANLREQKNGDVFHEYRSSYGENGFGMPMDISR